MAGPAAGTWPLEAGPHAVPALGAGRGSAGSYQGVGQGPGLRIRADRRRDLNGSRRRRLSKGGLKLAPSGDPGAVRQPKPMPPPMRPASRCASRSRPASRSAWKSRRASHAGPVTPGQRGGAPQARDLSAGLEGVGHVIAGAAYDARRRSSARLHRLRTGGKRADQAEPGPDRALSHQSGDLQGTPSGRVFPQQDRTHPARRLAMRENNRILQGVRTPRPRYDVDHLNEHAALGPDMELTEVKKGKHRGAACFCASLKQLSSRQQPPNPEFGGPPARNT